MMNICRLSFLYLIILSFMLMIFSLYFIYKDLVIMIEWELLTLNTIMIEMTMLFDWMSLMFMSFVLFISSLVIFYSEDYMMGDMNINRFIMLVLMFVLSMMLMILSPNLVSILLGWDGLGLVSYCLVIYYQNIKSYNAGMLTVLMNRIGDVTLLMSIAWMLNYGGWNFQMYMNYFVNHFEGTMIMILLMISAMTKSAQIPFSSWLPAAMAAPTPVSALVHSSTLVTAGVYLMIRFNLMIMSLGLNYYLLFIASLTMFMSGLGANFEYDLKKIVALSTLSQLGLMMSSLSFGMPKLAFFHLLMHALFKALLFLCVGSIIHLSKNFQDMRVMGSITNYIPLIGSILGVANLALCGLPFLAGFYSKDLILESFSLLNFNMFIYFLFYFSTGLTVCYSFRFSVDLFIYSMKFQSLMMFIDFMDIKMKMSYFLMIMSVIGGSMYSWIIFQIPSMIVLPNYLKLMVMLVMLLGAWIGLEVNKMYIGYNKFLKNSLLEFIGTMWFMPFMSIFFNNMVLNYGKYMNKFMDQGWYEYMGSQNIHKNIMNVSIKNMNFQNNMFMLFLISLFFWMMILLFLYLM
uniref:NADH-ubiquinone oxidoreductase chain 5 n=1 Tax=Dorcadia ioffi TaxID=2040515 RepID=A0A343KGF4_9NEOP|nr:NADH dehydrogenase subunit 5 [Dorcadia ioffi]ATF28036.1 NADH dehydrogenase subunit 5 [Dorcadia ioffi]